VRAVLDPNVIISALLSPACAPARALLAWLRGAFELVVSALLLVELERALGYPKLRKRIDPQEARQVVELLSRSARVAADPTEPAPVRSRDPADDYLIALASSERALIVSGDEHLLELAEDIPVLSPAGFLERLASEEI
jgi:putative PIN family toxin of toxin-antitoxin system